MEPSLLLSSSLASRAGVFVRWRTRLFGERDPVDEQLRDIARQGARMAHLAHVCALALILLFSAGSLVALGGDALASILAGWRAGRLDIPAAISVAVSTLLVACMDTAMLYAASVLRVMNARRAEESEKRLHYAVMFTVAVLEASTYAYMSWRYEAPVVIVAWILILARAAAAPLLSIYLSMARPLPVGPRDILYQVELASGKGVIRDAVTVANDGTAPLSRKMALYGASAVMTPADRARLAEMIAVVQESAAPRVVEALPPVGVRTPALEPPSRPPTGPGSPAARPRERLGRANGSTGEWMGAEGADKVVQMPTVRTGRKDTQATPAATRTRAKGRASAKAKGTTQAERAATIRERRLTWMEEQLATDPTIATRELVRRLRGAEHNRSISESTVSELRHVVEARTSAVAGAQPASEHPREEGAAL